MNVKVVIAAPGLVKDFILYLPIVSNYFMILPLHKIIYDRGELSLISLHLDPKVDKNIILILNLVGAFKSNQPSQQYNYNTMRTWRLVSKEKCVLCYNYSDSVE